MNKYQEAYLKAMEFKTRRHFLKKCASGLGAIALASMAGCGNESIKTIEKIANLDNPLSPKPSMFMPKAKRVIFLHMAGAPSQLELFDYKPLLHKLDGQDCPQSLLEGKQFAFIQGTPKMLGPQYSFDQYGQSGAWVSDRLPHFSTVVDEVAFLKAMHTDQFNHAPAQLLLHTGSARLGRPPMQT